jgi:hypothetical protein
VKTSERPPSPTIVTRFEELLIAAGTVRTELSVIWSAWNSADPAWAGTATTRTRLAHALNTLAERGTIELPAQTSALWDTGLPPLPARLSVTANRRPRTSGDNEALGPWAPAMAWAPAWIRTAKPTLPLRRAAAEINSWLMANLGTPVPRVAREERSLHVFDDEKRLAALTTTSLFAPERLGLDTLHCDAPLGSLRIARILERGPVLVVENKSTFDSAWRALRAAPQPPYAAVVFGSGDAAGALASDLANLAELIGVKGGPFYYAGDVDVAGIEAAHQFARAMHDRQLPVEMALPLWDAVARSAPTGEDLTALPSSAPPAIALAQHLGLPDSVAQRLHEGVRVPQERVNRTALAETTWWKPSGIGQ